MKEILMIILAVAISVTWNDWEIAWDVHIDDIPVKGYTFDTYQDCAFAIDGWTVKNGKFSCHPRLI